MPECRSVTTPIMHAALKKSLRGPGTKSLPLLPLYVQEPFWRNHFETPSVPDSRLPLTIGVVHWELFHLLSSEDVVRALKKMMDCAHGLDSRKLSDIQAIPAGEWAGHFNLWLLARYLPRSWGTSLICTEAIVTILKRANQRAIQKLTEI